MIIEEINRRFILFARSEGVIEHRINKMMIIRDGQVYMANLAIIGSFSVIVSSPVDGGVSGSPSGIT